MAKRFETQGTSNNYFVVTDTITDFEEIRRSVSDIYYKEDQGNIQFFSKNGQQISVEPYIYGSVVNGNDSDAIFADLDALKTFLNDNTGKFNAPLEGAYTLEQINEATRRTLTPYKLVTFLPVGSEFTTDALVPNTPTKLLIPTTVKTVNSFALVDKNGGVGEVDLAYQFQGGVESTFSVDMMTSVLTSANNVVMTYSVHRNGAEIDGLSTTRKIGTGADVGAIGITGEVALAPLDFIEIYIESSLETTGTFIRTSINVCERN